MLEKRMGKLGLDKDDATKFVRMTNEHPDFMTNLGTKCKAKPDDPACSAETAAAIFKKDKRKNTEDTILDLMKSTKVNDVDADDEDDAAA